MTRLIGILSALYIISALSITPLHAKSSVVLCNQPYALCSAARCIPDPKNSAFALCTCDVYNGLSAGFSSCKKRTPFIAQDKTQRIISTFSFKNSNKSSMTCPPGTLWTNCVDAPCTVNPENPNESLCSCPIKHRSTIVTFGGHCNTETCNSGFWSGATLEQSMVLRHALSKELTSTPVIKHCSPR